MMKKRLAAQLLAAILVLCLFAGSAGALVKPVPDESWPWDYNYGAWYNGVWYPDPTYYDTSSNVYISYVTNLPDVTYTWNGETYTIASWVVYEWIAGNKRLPFQTPGTLPVTPGTKTDVYIGSSMQITQSMLGGTDPYTRGVFFRTSNAAVASVTDSGVITGLSAGMARISAIDGYGRVIGVWDIAVDYPASISSIVLNKTKVTLKRNSQYQMQATSRGQVINALWSSSDPNIATVDQGGWVTTYGNKGTVVITAMAGSGGAIRKCTIKVK